MKPITVHNPMNNIIVISLNSPKKIYFSRWSSEVLNLSSPDDYKQTLNCYNSLHKFFFQYHLKETRRVRLSTVKNQGYFQLQFNKNGTFKNLNSSSKFSFFLDRFLVNFMKFELLKLSPSQGRFSHCSNDN